MKVLALLQHSLRNVVMLWPNQQGGEKAFMTHNWDKLKKWSRCATADLHEADPACSDDEVTTENLAENSTSLQCPRTSSHNQGLGDDGTAPSAVPQHHQPQLVPKQIIHLEQLVLSSTTITNDYAQQLSQLHQDAQQLPRRQHNADETALHTHKVAELHVWAMLLNCMEHN